MESTTNTLGKSEFEQKLEQMSVEQLALALKDDFAKHQNIFATAESCTGGLISAHITDISGSSSYFDRAFITYSNQAKMDLLHVKEETLNQFGAVSEQIAKQMALGALERSLANIVVAVTGVAGPTGGTEDKPVGTVCIAVADHQLGVKAYTHHFSGDRNQVRLATVKRALINLLCVSEGICPDQYK